MLIQTLYFVSGILAVCLSIKYSVRLELVNTCKTAAKFEWLIFGLDEDSTGISCSVQYGILAVCLGVKYSVRLELVNTCKTAAEFEWLIFGLDEDSPGISCSVHYGHTRDFNTGHVKERPYPAMKNMGSFTLQGLDSLSGQQFSVQLICGDSKSDVKTFVVNDKKACNDTTDKPNIEEPVVFKGESSFLGTTDSLLGIAIGFLGLLIIAVSTFYIVRKIRRRNRLERIRQYLGSSLIDPFDNLQSRIDTDRDTGSERLMGSSDQLYSAQRLAGGEFNSENTD